ncbi:MAG: TIR domain-containing protein [Magnetococcales bacterium]|nr:TIR domain-containing protein [Magnetococcales bacterium]
MSGIFISHAHYDEALAEALADMIDTLFTGIIPPVNYSSRKGLSGGIEPGEDWFRWIVKQVREADVAIILLTPNSVVKPWVLWEAGAVAGSAFSSDADSRERCLYPLICGLNSDSIPGPFSRTQVVNAQEHDDIQKFIEKLYSQYKDKFDPMKGREFGRLQEKAINRYLETIAIALPRMPIAVTEAAIQEWLDRLDKLVKERRYSEAGVLEDWMDVAFGRDATDRQRPLDVRLHRRLAEIYASAGMVVEAERQYRLARQTAPRDIMIMRGLGKALLDRDDLDGCRILIEEIERLDSKAFKKNPENAALKAKWQQKSRDIPGAIATLEDAFRHTPTSYYIGDLLGQTFLTSNKTDEAKQVYQQVRSIIDTQNESGIWAAASLLTAAIILDDNELTKKTLERIHAITPSAEQRNSIKRGIERTIKDKKEVPKDLRDVLIQNGWI